VNPSGPNQMFTKHAITEYYIASNRIASAQTKNWKKLWNWKITNKNTSTLNPRNTISHRFQSENLVRSLTVDHHRQSRPFYKKKTRLPRIIFFVVFNYSYKMLLFVPRLSSFMTDCDQELWLSWSCKFSLLCFLLKISASKSKIEVPSTSKQ